MRAKHRLASAVLLLACAGCLRGSGSPHVQTADADFDPSVERPAAAGRSLRVVVDEAHDNFHTAAGRYAPFVALLAADGFTVEAGTSALSEASLAGVDLLVIANASPPADVPTASAFSAAEVAAVDAWVRSGGALLLIADHAPFGAAARELGETFGVGMEDAHLRDHEHADSDLGSPYILVFDRDEGMIGDHPVTRGRGPEERIERVVTFGGQALRVLPPSESGAAAHATPLLLLADTAEIVEDPDGQPDAPGRPAAGMAQAVAVEHGAGRVVVMGEAAVFSSQVIRGEVAEGMGRDELRIGMSRTDTDDRQLALNTVRWLAGLL